MVWIQNPFDNLPEEGYRKQRYRLMAEAFERSGEKVLYWTSDFSHASKSPRQVSGLPRSVRLIPTPKYVRNISFRRIFSHIVYALRWYRQALKEVEVPRLIISSMPTMSGAWVAIRLARHFKAAVIVDVQDAWPETFERVFPRWALAPLRAVARHIYRTADGLSGVCERYRDLVGRKDYYRAYLGVEF